jgi:hypothetical protein
MTPRRLAAWGLCLALSGAASTAAAQPRAEFQAEPASAAVRTLADWVTASGDNRGLPFVIVDKVAAKVFVFRPQGALRGAAPALLGLARGDVSTPGVGDRPLASIKPQERTTPAGRFVADRGKNLGDHDILWIDYKNAISLHPVVTNNPKEQRLKRLATPSAADNRISYGCINVPAAFYKAVVAPAFTGTSGIVYILPEVRPMRSVFPGLPAVDAH